MGVRGGCGDTEAERGIHSPHEPINMETRLFESGQARCIVGMSYANNFGPHVRRAVWRD